jgi:hypothetical protein
LYRGTRSVRGLGDSPYSLSCQREESSRPVGLSHVRTHVPNAPDFLVRLNPASPTRSFERRMSTSNSPTTPALTPAVHDEAVKHAVRMLATSSDHQIFQVISKVPDHFLRLVESDAAGELASRLLKIDFDQVPLACRLPLAAALVRVAVMGARTQVECVEAARTAQSVRLTAARMNRQISLEIRLRQSMSTPHHSAPGTRMRGRQGASRSIRRRARSPGESAESGEPEPARAGLGEVRAPRQSPRRRRRSRPIRRPPLAGTRGLQGADCAECRQGGLAP